MTYTPLSLRVKNSNAVNISIEVGYQHILPLKTGQKLAELLHQLISRNDSKTVIELSEIIDIHKHYCGNNVFFLCPVHKVRKKPYKIISVIKPCEHIVISNIGKLVVLVLKFGYILKTYNFIRSMAFFIVKDGGLTFHPCSVVFQPYDPTAGI